VMELWKEASFIKSRTFDALTVYVAVAVFYLVLTSLLSVGVHMLEKKMKNHVEN
jgi:ABC-type amino acid transport system permease subunit